MNTARVVRSISFKRGVRGSLIAAAAIAACMMFGTAPARAGCAAPGNQPLGNLVRPAAFVTVSDPAATTDPGAATNPSSIVGFWHVLLLIDGNPATPLFQSLVQYHSDGMELESAATPPLGPGNFCMGVWKQKRDTVEIYHIGWLYSSGQPSGYLKLTEKNELSKDGNSFTGTFDFKQYDITGGYLIGEYSGTTTGHRIDFHHPFALF